MKFTPDHNRSSCANARGFTFIEILVSMLIFTLAVLAAISIAQGSVKATREAKEISTAAWLLQSTMSDLETKLESEGIDKGCVKKKDGKFEAPFNNFTYSTYCYEIDYKLSETAAKLSQSSSSSAKDDAHAQEDVILKMVLSVAGTYITKAMRELHVEINWLQGKTKRQVDATTHFVRYDQPVQLPGLGGGTGTPAGGSSSSAPTTTGTPGSTPH